MKPSRESRKLVLECAFVKINFRGGTQSENKDARVEHLVGS